MSKQDSFAFLPPLKESQKLLIIANYNVVINPASTEPIKEQAQCCGFAKTHKAKFRREIDGFHRTWSNDFGNGACIGVARLLTVGYNFIIYFGWHDTFRAKVYR